MKKTYNIYMKDDTVKEFASIEEFAKYFNDKLVEFKLTSESKKNSNENSVKNTIETAIGNHYVKIDDMFYDRKILPIFELKHIFDYLSSNKNNKDLKNFVKLIFTEFFELYIKSTTLNSIFDYCNFDDNSNIGVFKICEDVNVNEIIHRTYSYVTYLEYIEKIERTDKRSYIKKEKTGHIYRYDGKYLYFGVLKSEIDQRTLYTYDYVLYLSNMPKNNRKSIGEKIDFYMKSILKKYDVKYIFNTKLGNSKIFLEDQNEVTKSNNEDFLKYGLPSLEKDLKRLDEYIGSMIKGNDVTFNVFTEDEIDLAKYITDNSNVNKNKKEEKTENTPNSKKAFPIQIVEFRKEDIVGFRKEDNIVKSEEKTIKDNAVLTELDNIIQEFENALSSITKTAQITIEFNDKVPLMYMFNKHIKYNQKKNISKHTIIEYVTNKIMKFYNVKVTCKVLNSVNDKQCKEYQGLVITKEK